MKDLFKWAAVGACVASLGWNVYGFMRSIPIVLGGGIRITSPDGLFFAAVQSESNHNKLAADATIIKGRLELWRSGMVANNTKHGAIITLQVEPAGTDHEMGYRELDEPISWSADSRQVTYDLPHITVTIAPKLDHPVFASPYATGDDLEEEIDRKSPDMREK